MELHELKQQIAVFLKSNGQQAFTATIIADGLRMNQTDKTYQAVKNALDALVREDQVRFDAIKETYQDANRAQGIVGSFSANDKGFGFVHYSEEDPDIFIPNGATKQAMHQDEVRVVITKPAKSKDMGPTGQVESITERALKQIVGVFELTTLKAPFIGRVKMTGKKHAGLTVWVKATEMPITDQEMVIVQVDEYPNVAFSDMVGHISQILGYKDEPGMDILQIVHANKIPIDFPQDVLDQAGEIPSEVPASDYEGRADLTEQMLVTIDGADTKDIDDAVVAWKLDNGNYHLGVHIADVTHYVRENTVLDDEAYNRGTSVYLTDRVIPMLPRNISNGIASLNPGVVRLAMSAEMEIDPKGQVVSHSIHPSVIKSHQRMTYEAVNKILDNDLFVQEEYADYVPMFQTMHELHDILVKMRDRRGAIEFDAPEAEIIVDETGKAVDIQLRERGVAERMIESFMLAANETVAEHFDKLNVPFLYRVHEVPDGDRAANFFDFAKTLGHPIVGDPNKIKPGMFQNLIKEVDGLPEAQMVSTMMLRAMKQAKYSDQPVGHFGIGADYYTHFTSPIRRYPDLMVHRLIKFYAKNGVTSESKAVYRDKLAQVGVDTSIRERRAIDAERSTNDMKRAEYMEDKIGMEFDGVVNSALKFGLFISLENTVEGLVHISNLTDDFYEYDENHAALIGRSSHRIFQIGQPVRIKVLRANKAERTVDFVLVNPESAPTTDIRVAKKNNDKGAFGRRDQKNNRKFDKQGSGNFKNGGQERNTKRNF